MAAFDITKSGTDRDFAPSTVVNNATGLDLEYCSQMVLLAGRYLEKGKIDSAEASLRRGLARVPDHPECTAHLAVCLAAGKRKYVTAEKLVKDIIEANPYDSTAWYALGRINLLGGRREQAFKNFEEAKRVSCDDAEIETKVDKMDPRRDPVLKFLPRNHFLNIWFGMLRAQFSK
jgi:tetratricopeptide (TPR) repeat protein